MTRHAQILMAMLDAWTLFIDILKHGHQAETVDTGGGNVCAALLALVDSTEAPRDPRYQPKTEER